MAYRYIVAPILVMIIVSSLLLSYVAVALPVTDALNNISISNVTSQESSPTTLPLISFILGNGTMTLGQGYFNITNTGNEDFTVSLKLSATVTWMNTGIINYCLGSTTIPKVTVKGHSSTIISATVNDSTPIVSEWGSKASGSWIYSWSVQASANVNYLFLHPAMHESFSHTDYAIFY